MQIEEQPNDCGHVSDDDNDNKAIIELRDSMQLNSIQFAGRFTSIYRSKFTQRPQIAVELENWLLSPWAASTDPPNTKHQTPPHQLHRTSAKIESFEQQLPLLRSKWLCEFRQAELGKLTYR